MEGVMVRAISTGDRVEVRFITPDGNVLWNPATVIRRRLDCLVVTMATGHRKEVEHDKGLYRLPGPGDG
jgi:hypothetical protein